MKSGLDASVRIQIHLEMKNILGWTHMVSTTNVHNFQMFKLWKNYEQCLD